MPWRKAKGEARQPLLKSSGAGPMDPEKHLSRSQEWRWACPGRVCGQSSCLFNSLDPLDIIPKQPTRILRMLHQQEHCQPEPKGTETHKVGRKKLLDLWDPTWRKGTDRTISYKHMLS